MSTSPKRKCRVCGKVFLPRCDTKRVKQLVCSNKCCAAYYDNLTKKNRRVATETAKMIGKRSMGEVWFAAENLEGKRNIKSEYETESFTYVVAETRTYTPDFKISRGFKGPPFYIEYKGILDLQTRKKMLRVRDQHPELDIRFVFQKPNNKIRKNSPTTYGKWASDNGFKWADNKLPKEWLK